MAMNIKNVEVERLVQDVAELTGETRTEAVRRALLERRERLLLTMVRSDRAERLHRVLVEEIWPLVPADVRGTRLTREEEDTLLGYGPDGV